MTLPSHSDAACLAALAGAAEGDLSIGAAVPPGWSVFRTFPAIPRPPGPRTISAQGFIASGALPSDPSRTVTVVALAYPLASYAAASSASPIGRNTGLSPLPAGIAPGNAQALAPAVAGYAQIRAGIWAAFAMTPARDLWVTGTHLGAAMAAIAAIDLRPGQTGPDGKTKGPAQKARCVMFSAPAQGDAGLAAQLAAQTTLSASIATTHLGLAIDGFPGTPVAGAVPAGTPMPLPARTETPPGLIAGMDTWVQRGPDAYIRALGQVPVDQGILAPRLGGTARIDIARAATLADLIGLPYLMREMPGLRASAPIEPYAITGRIGDGANIWGAAASAPGGTAILIRGAIGWPEFTTTTCDFDAVAAPFQGSEWDMAKVHSGAATLFGQLRTDIAAAAGAALKSDPAQLLDFAGHGIGGAVAALAAIDTVISLKPATPPRVWMFGTPNFITYDFLSAADPLIGATTLRINRQSDFLPRIPFALASVGLGQAVSLIGRPAISDPGAHGLSGYASLLTPRSGSSVEFA